jgi:protein gp37
MSANTSIEWATRSWNPLRGCSKVSDGCKNCYAISQANRFSGEGMPFEGLVHKKNGSLNWTGKITFAEKALMDPYKWKEKERIFVNSMSDVFHDNVPEEYIRRIFDIMADLPRHTFMILTKRPKRMLQLMQKFSQEAMLYNDIFPLPNVWLGVSVENQLTANERIPLLMQTPAAIRFLSCEPLLGPVDLTNLDLGDQLTGGYGKRRILWDALSGWESQFEQGILPEPGRIPRVRISNPNNRIQWVIVGGERGHQSRPMHPHWVQSLLQQCLDSETAFMFKQYGDWTNPAASGIPIESIRKARHYQFDDGISVWKIGRKRAGRNFYGESWDAYPDTSEILHDSILKKEII